MPEVRLPSPVTATASPGSAGGVCGGVASNTAIMLRSGIA